MTAENQKKPEEETSSPKVSIIVPFFNEEENVLPLLEKISQQMNSLSENYEIIGIDDGSTDETFQRLKEGYEKLDHIRVITLRRNFGQTAALSAGMDHSRGEIIITMDGDLQNDPKDIPLLLQKINEGYDIVSGWRKNRKEPFLSRRLPSKIANYLISKISKVNLHDYGCTLKAYRYEVVKNLNLYGEMHRFVPAIASTMGVKIAEVTVNHNPRASGKSKYGFARTYKVILDLLTLKFMLSFFHRPMLLYGIVGTLSALIGIGLAVSALILRFGYQISIYRRPLLTVVPPFLILFGVMLISFGLQSEMMMRIYYESQKKPIYVIRQILDEKSKKGSE